MNFLKPHYWLLFLGLFVHSALQGQNQKYLLKEIIDQLEEIGDYTFSYDPEMIEGFYFVPEEATHTSDISLDDLEAVLPFAFELIENEYVIVKSKSVTLEISVKELETNERIPGVYVKKNGTYQEITSDGDGNLRLNVDWKKEDILSFEFIGYETQSISVIDWLRRGQREVALSSSTTVLDEITIRSYLGEGISAHQKDHTLNIENNELGILPGDVDKDLLVSLKTLPGIHSVTGRAGEIRVRGGTPDQTLILFDNIPIYHKGYYFGAISPFNTEMVDKVKVYRSGYSPNLGGRVGGAIEISSENSIPKSFRGGVASNSYFFSGYGKAPLITNKLGISIAARTSHPFDYTSPKEKEFQKMVLAGSNILAITDDPGISLDEVTYDFWDINGALLYQPNANHNFKFNFLSINNKNVTTTSNQTRGSVTSRENLLENSGINLSWNGQWGSWKTNAFVTNSFYSYALNTEENIVIQSREISDQEVANTIDNTKFGISSTKLIGTEGSEVSFGYELSRIEVTFKDILNFANPMIPDRTIPPVERPGTINSAFASFFIPDWNKFMINAGVRLNYFDQKSFFRPEPRIFLNYNLSDKITIKSSLGFYSQYLNRKLFFDFTDVVIEKLVWGLIDAPTRDVMTSWQALFGGAYQSSNWVFDVDVYYKEVEGLSTNGPFVEVAPGREGPSLLLGELFTHGLDVLVKYKVGNLNLWSNYTYGQVTMKFDDLKTDQFPANYDQTHNFNVSASYQIQNFKASAGWFFSSGLPNYLENTFFPFTGPSRIPLENPSPIGNIDRFNGIHQLDASIAYEIIPKSGNQKITLGLSALNLYNKENLLETVNVRLQSPADQLNTEVASRYTIGFAPDVMIKFEF